MNKYLQLFRTGNAVMGVVGVLVACFMAAGTDLLSHWVNLLLSAVIVFSFIAGGNSLNDYIDAEIDRTAHPERPIPSGRMSRKQAKDIGMFMLALSVMVSLFTFDVACVLIVLVAVTLMVSYEMFLKQRGFVGNVTIAVMTGMLFLLGGAIVGDVAANVIVALMAMSVSIGREISKDIEDKENYTFVKADICDFDAMYKLMVDNNVDGIIHLAAESHVDRSIKDPFTFARTNVMGTLYYGYSLEHYAMREPDDSRREWLMNQAENIFMAQELQNEEIRIVEENIASIGLDLMHLGLLSTLYFADNSPEARYLIVANYDIARQLGLDEEFDKQFNTYYNYKYSPPSEEKQLENDTAMRLHLLDMMSHYDFDNSPLNDSEMTEYME